MYPESQRLTAANRTVKSSVTFMNWGIVWNGNVLTGRLICPKSESAYSLSDILISDCAEKYYLSDYQAQRLLENL